MQYIELIFLKIIVVWFCVGVVKLLNYNPLPHCIRNCWWVWLLGVLGVLGLLGYFLVLSVLLELLATLGRQSWQDEHTPSPFGYSP